LNRIFKTYDTTPGKFMKKVKLNMASELFKSGKSIEEVVAKVGYSASYLKKEL
jgi:AraC-like DNA-binding protein